MNKQTNSFYDKFSLFYPLVDVLLKPQKKVLFNEVNRLTDGNLLEIGVGNGTHFKYYNKHKITAIDTSEAMVKTARKNSAENIEVLKMDGELLLFDDEKFDYVVLSHVIAVVTRPEQLISEAYRVLKPGGKMFILNHFTPNNWLKYIDQSFAIVSKAFHFRSVFYIEDLESIKKFRLSKEIHFGLGSYFKLLIYKK
ncbi:MAG: methyltransferase domain-containing protein [Pedobacter sp.]|uniref:class I SAM-dependent methyltransferase n=1 Tax=Pedobacter sp. TaxID=1411316 RepID=UPI002807FB8E|nr:methyltransferase domain-containing protein [Pedobacter sp.]MDQ8005362.1 methyltransferase domain-containing protein [Pedobacter sp.]